MNKKTLFQEVEGRLYNYKKLESQIKIKEIYIKKIENEFCGCKAQSYEEKTGPTYNISSSVENEVIRREEDLNRLKEGMKTLEIEKEAIECALTSLNSFETEFFNAMYMNNEKINMDYMANVMHIDRSHCFRIRKRIVCKIMDMLYPKIKEFELPIFSWKA
ncbi:hypothetical protein ACTPEW_12270 [Clostridioides difficile]